MQTRQIQMNDVIYNAAEQCFEALVTVTMAIGPANMPAPSTRR